MKVQEKDFWTMWKGRVRVEMELKETTLDMLFEHLNKTVGVGRTTFYSKWKNHKFTQVELVEISNYFGVHPLYLMMDESLRAHMKKKFPIK